MNNNNYEKSKNYHIGIIGAGLAGAMVGCLLDKLGFQVSIYEKRDDPRKSSSEDISSEEFGRSISSTKRSINLAISHRGFSALKEIGLYDTVFQEVIRMPCRVIHNIDKSITKQAYGKEDEAIWSVGRQYLNFLLLDHLSKKAHNSIHFEHTLIAISKSGLCSFECAKGEINEKFDLIIGADGAYSAVRECILKQGRINFSRTYIKHGYKELSIPPKLVKQEKILFSIENDKKEKALDSIENYKKEYALDSPNGLHIWPRGEFMLIALPNPDKSFTATLFAPYHGKDGFDSVTTKEDDIKNYFNKYFPDVVPLMPDLTSDYIANPVGSLVTIRVDPWHSGRTLLIGDAAHAVVPFYGQGMNAAMEDSLILYELIKCKFFDETHGVTLQDIISEFSNLRIPAANGLADLCVEHYNDMASNTSSSFYLIQKKIEAFIFNLFPSYFIPLYTMVAFTRTPYHLAIKKSEEQNRMISKIASGLVAGLLGGITFLTLKHFKHFR